MDKVKWRVIKPSRILSGSSNRGIELHLLKGPHSDLVHTPSPKPQHQKTFPIARAIPVGVTRSLPGPSHNKTSTITATDTVKKLASKDDLIEALNKLAEKRNALHKCSNLNQPPENTKQPNHDTNQQNEPIIISALNQANKKIMRANNLDEVLEILKGGVAFDRIPEPTTTENIHWMRIKIPKKGH